MESSPSLITAHDKLTYAAPAPKDVLRMNREAFVNDLCALRLVSLELISSGALDYFDIDPITGSDALIHMLVGDSKGGLHHVPTATMLGRHFEIASKIYNNDASKRHLTFSEQRTEHRAKQEIMPSGTYRFMTMTIWTPNPFSGIIEPYTKKGGSTVFPDEWTTQQAIEAALSTARYGAVEPYIERGFSRHTMKIDGVGVVAITNADSGNIMSAFPDTDRGRL